MAHLFSRILAVVALCAAFTAHAAPGNLDPSFGAGSGKVNTGILANDEGNALALQPDGKIIVAGACHNGSNMDFCLARYKPDGALDDTFNGNGKITTGSGSARALALQPDGNIVVAGQCSRDFCLVRFLPNGALDETFNGTGTVTTDIGGSTDDARALALQPDGKIVVAGLCYSGRNAFCLARYKPDGALDETFNVTGKVITDIKESTDEAYALALRPDGKIVVAGGCVNGADGAPRAFCLTRYLPDGVLDESFGEAGKVITAFGTLSNTATALALQPDGKIVAAGRCYYARNLADFCLVRYLPSGALDTSFDGDGKVGAGWGHGVAEALALQPDGKIVVAGWCMSGSTSNFCVARYEGGSFDSRSCSMDIDGDNRTFATTDGLIATRVMLGLTGNAVISGITFASHASRTTWPAIRDYLVSQCGMVIVP